MKIIDCHTHPLFKDKELKEFAKEANVNFSLEGLLEELKRNNVEKDSSNLDSQREKQ